MLRINPYYFSKSKRTFDIALAILVGIILIPVFISIAFFIALTAGFPVFFLQKRMGQAGQIFTMYKFRTMKKNALLLKHKYLHLNEAPLPMFKIHNDPRFTGIGKFLSRSGLDELPQLINIIKGEMSFVGPRPLPVEEAKAMPKSWRDFREKVKPGIFSDWSASWERHKSFAKWRRLEETTLKKGSLWSDIISICQVFASQLLLYSERKKQAKKLN